MDLVSACQRYPIPTNVHLGILQLAKGHRFAAAVWRGSDYLWSMSEDGRALLQTIASAESQSEADNESDLLLDQMALLEPYTGRLDERNTNPRARLTTLQRIFDSKLYQEEVPHVGKIVHFLDYPGVQRLLPTSTALLLLYVGLDMSSEWTTLYTTIVTREDVKFRFTSLYQGQPLRESDLGNVSRYVPEMIHGIFNLRSAVTSDPMSRVDSREGQRQLTNAFGALTPTEEVLDELWKAGKRHLCMIPHGPLHFAPFHLMGTPGDMLCDRFAVTFLPNLAVLGPPVGRGWRQRYQVLSSFGLSFQNGEHGLRPLPGATEEAASIAGVFGLQAITGPAVNESAVFDALETSRYVHLATHGRNVVAAPAFHCLYVNPDGESDGRIAAYEILALDLRGLELVTLSACETALGRMDSADNPRGIPSALLLRGAQALIGTLWPVESETSKYFFVHLYQSLAKGASRLDAFQKAQRATRAVHPQYRDWGAFYFVGDWR